MTNKQSNNFPQKFRALYFEIPLKCRPIELPCFRRLTNGCLPHCKPIQTLVYQHYWQKWLDFCQLLSANHPALLIFNLEYRVFNSNFSPQEKSLRTGGTRMFFYSARAGNVMTTRVVYSKFLKQIFNADF